MDGSYSTRINWTEWPRLLIRLLSWRRHTTPIQRLRQKANVSLIYPADWNLSSRPFKAHHFSHLVPPSVPAYPRTQNRYSRIPTLRRWLASMEKPAWCAGHCRCNLPYFCRNFRIQKKGVGGWGRGFGDTDCEGEGYHEYSQWVYYHLLFDSVMLIPALVRANMHTTDEDRLDESELIGQMSCVSTLIIKPVVCSGL